MVGNVEEWTADCYKNSHTSAPAEGSAWRVGDCSNRVVRGGPGSTILTISAPRSASGSLPINGTKMWASGSPGRLLHLDFLSPWLVTFWRRTTVTLVAGQLEAARSIRCRRGSMQITDRAELERRSCECHARLSDNVRLWLRRAKRIPSKTRLADTLCPRQSYSPLLVRRSKRLSSRSGQLPSFRSAMTRR